MCVCPSHARINDTNDTNDMDDVHAEEYASSSSSSSSDAAAKYKHKARFEFDDIDLALSNVTTVKFSQTVPLPGISDVGSRRLVTALPNLHQSFLPLHTHS